MFVRERGEVGGQAKYCNIFMVFRIGLAAVEWFFFDLSDVVAKFVCFLKSQNRYARFFLRKTRLISRQLLLFSPIQVSYHEKI